MKQNPIYLKNFSGLDPNMLLLMYLFYMTYWEVMKK